MERGENLNDRNSAPASEILNELSSMAAKSRDAGASAGNGGGRRRDGAGRPNGIISKRCREREAVEQARRDGLVMPVDSLLRRLNDLCAFARISRQARGNRRTLLRAEAVGGCRHKTVVGHERQRNFAMARDR
jgi:hypothetical protein